METTVRVIKANPFAKNIASVDGRQYENVAAYARVSTSLEEQEDSFERQVDYYTRYIQANPNWKFVKVYSDPGISGTKAEKRPGFMEMINDAKEGRIDRILVKSIARFARNTVDALKYIRELKDIGVSIYFEAQKIDTSTPGGDILLTILAATAEEESRTISKNVKWSMTKKFEKGDLMLNYTNFLGYTKNADKEYVIVEDEARIVRRIFRDYLYGYSITRIVGMLNDENVKTPSGKDKWYYNVVKNILTNEKYYGAVLMQKTFKPDVLSKKRIRNEGQVDTFFVENRLPPIIDKATYDMVQFEMKKRDELKGNSDKNYGKFSSKYPFSRMIRCGCCGGFYVRTHNMRLNGHNVPSWWCDAHWKNDDVCPQKGISEEAIKHAFVKAVSELSLSISDIKSVVKANITSVLSENIEDDINQVEEKINNLQEEMLSLHKKKTEGKISTGEYGRLGNKLAEEIDEAKRKREELKARFSSDALTLKRIDEITDALESITPDSGFDEQLFRRLVEGIVINERYKITFKFKIGVEKTIISEEK